MKVQQKNFEMDADVNLIEKFFEFFPTLVNNKLQNNFQKQ